MRRYDRRRGRARRGRGRCLRRSRGAVPGMGSLVRRFANAIVHGAPVSNSVISKRPVAVEGRLVAHDRGRRGGLCRLWHAGFGRSGGRENQRGNSRASTSETHGENSPKTSGTRTEQGTFYSRAAGARAMRPGTGRVGLDASGRSLEAAECGGHARRSDCRKSLAGRRQERDELHGMAGKRRCGTHGRTQVAHRRAARRSSAAGRVATYPMTGMVLGCGTRFVAMLVIAGRRMRVAAIACFMRLAHRRRRRTAHVAEQAGRSHRTPEREQQGDHQQKARSELHAKQANTLAAPGQRTIARGSELRRAQPQRMGLATMPNQGYRTPAATGTPRKL